MTRCLVNVASHAHYPVFQERLMRSLDQLAPGVPRVFYTRNLPPQWPEHASTPYGFKLYAMKEAHDKGHDVVMWLDADVRVTAPLDPVWKLIEQDGHYLIQSDGDLHDYCNEETLKYFGMSREDKEPQKILGGKIFAIDFRNERAVKWFSGMWKAMQDGLYQGTFSAHSCVKGHRGDEAVGAILAHRLGMKVDDSLTLFVSDSSRQGVFHSGYQPMMEMIAEHSFRSDMMQDGSYVLDVGCRNFAFSKECIKRNWRTFSIDPDPAVGPTPVSCLTHKRAALVAKDCAGQSMEFVAFGNGTGNHLSKYSKQNPPDARRMTVQTIDIGSLTKEFGVDRWALVKLDCEGAEYDILRQWPGPIANQISVEFHEHIGANPCPEDPEKTYTEIKNHLGQWYKIVQHEKSVRHCLSEANYWDSLWVLR